MASRALWLTASLFLMSGCAWTAQQVNLKADVTVNEANLGRGQSVFVDVNDERPKNALGTKVPTGGGEITPIQDPKEVVSQALVLGVTRLGFKPVKGQGGSATLKAELRAIDYKVNQGFWAGGLTVDVALKSICIVDGRQQYEKMHRGHHEESIQVAQTAAENEEYINAALSQAINEVLTDGALMQCLAGTTTPGPVVER